MKKPFEAILDMARLSAKQHHLLHVESSKSQRTFVTWLVGFSFASLSLMLSHKEMLVVEISLFGFKSAFIGMVISIVSGLIHVYLLGHLFVLSHRATWLLESKFSNENVIDFSGPEIDNSLSLNQILRRFREDFDTDYSEIQETYYRLGETERQKMIDDLVLNYKESMEWGENNKNRGIDFIKKAYSEVFKFSESKMEELFNNEVNYSRMRTIQYWSAFTFNIHLCAFILTLVLVGILVIV